MNRSGKVYVMQRVDGSAVKVGYSKNPHRRASDVGARARVVFETEFFDDARSIEQCAHETLILSSNQVFGEWFDATIDAAIDAVRSGIRQSNGEEFRLGGKFVASKRRSDKLTNGTTVGVRLPADMMESIRRIRKSRNDGASVAQIIREIMVKGLKADGRL